MARLTEASKKRLVADLETGAYSVRELAKKYQVSNATIQKYKADMENQSEQIVNAGILYKTGLASIKEPEKVNAIVNAVDEKTQQLIYFQNSAMLNQEAINTGLEEVIKEAKKNPLEYIANMPFLEAHSRSTQRNKETVLGKDPQVVNNNTNAQQTIEGYGVKVIE